MSVTIVLLIAAFAAAVYLAISADAPSWPRSLVKTVPLLGFALAGWMAGAPPFLVAALGLSAMGDFALSRRDEAAFLYGLSAFALAHLLYVLQFLALSDLPIWDAFVLQPLLALFLVFVGLSAEIWLVPFVGKLRWPVRGYMVVITAMGLAVLTLPMGAATLGALLFIASDVLLAVQLFRMSDEHPLLTRVGWAVWIFYVTGQALILGGVAG